MNGMQTQIRSGNYLTNINTAIAEKPIWKKIQTNK